MNHGSASAVLLLCLLAACAPQEPPAPNTVTIVASDFGYEAPEQIPAGVTTVQMVNTGAEPHHAIIVRLLDDASVQQYLAAVEAGDFFPEYAEYVGGPGAAIPGDTAAVTQDLAPGRYLVFCFIFSPDGVPHLMKGMMRNLEVVETTETPAPEPQADVVMQLADYAIGFAEPVPSGRVTLRIENAGPQVHDVEILQLAPGKTEADLMAWLEAGEQGPPPGRFVGGVTGMQRGLHSTISAQLEPGDYVALCFVPDINDGRPHFMHGMVRQFTVS